MVTLTVVFFSFVCPSQLQWVLHIWRQKVATNKSHGMATSTQQSVSFWDQALCNKWYICSCLQHQNGIVRANCWLKEGGAASNHWPVVERQSFRGDCCRPVVMRIPVPFSKIDDFSQFTNRSLHSAHHKSVVVGLTFLRGSVFNFF